MRPTASDLIDARYLMIIADIVRNALAGAVHPAFDGANRAMEMVRRFPVRSLRSPISIHPRNRLIPRDHARDQAECS